MPILGLIVLLSAIAFGDASGQASQRSLPRLPERADTLTVRYGDAVIGRGVMTWAHRPDGFLQVYVWTSARDGSSVTDSLFASASTLRPTREVRIVTDTVIEVEFGGDSLRLRISPRGERPPAYAIAAPGRVFSSASIESLAASMPLEANASMTYPTFYAPPARYGMRSTTIRVEGTEMLGGRQAWRVTANTPGGGTTFWIDALTRGVLQSETREGDASITFRR